MKLGVELLLLLPNAGAGLPKAGAGFPKAGGAVAAGAGGLLFPN